MMFTEQKLPVQIAGLNGVHVNLRSQRLTVLPQREP